MQGQYAPSFEYEFSPAQPPSYGTGMQSGYAQAQHQAQPSYQDQQQAYHGQAQDQQQAYHGQAQDQHLAYHGHAQEYQNDSQFDPYGGHPFGNEEFDLAKVQMRTPDAIDALAREGKSIKFENGKYYVLDGPAFERDFCALRINREDRRKGNKPNRPFSSMSRWYQLLQGEKWAATGTIFKLKAAGDVQAAARTSPATESADGETLSPPEASPERDQALPAAADHVQADKVLVQVRDADGQLSNCSLQRFLEITGADKVYSMAMSAGAEQKGQKRARADSDLGDLEQVHSFPLWTDGVSAMRNEDVEVVVSSLWTANSLGDQAYFFKRKSGVPAFSNGSIVRLVGGELQSDRVDAGASGRGLHMVVSDKNAKWKGEPIPSAEEEPLGHWCCFLGQVPVTVDGAVKCGDHIGPKGDGSGMGQVMVGGGGAMVGIALDDKPAGEAGVVKTLCFAGLGALEGGKGEEYGALLSRMERSEHEVQELRGAVRDMGAQMDVMQAEAARKEGQMQQLETRVHVVEKVIALEAQSAGGASTAVCPNGDVDSARSLPAGWGWKGKLLVGGGVCMLVVIAAICAGVLLRPAPGDDGIQTGSQTPAPAGPSEWGGDPAELQITGVSTLVGVDEESFQDLAQVFANTVHIFVPGAGYVDVVRVSEGVDRRREGSRQLLQEVPVLDVHYSVGGFTSLEGLIEAGHFLTHYADELGTALRERGFEELQQLHTEFTDNVNEIAGPNWSAADYDKVLYQFWHGEYYADFLDEHGWVCEDAECESDYETVYYDDEDCETPDCEYDYEYDDCEEEGCGDEDEYDDCGDEGCDYDDEDDVLTECDEDGCEEYGDEADRDER